MKPSVIDICALILLSAMIVILPQDRLSDRAMCQNSVGAAKIEPAINLSRPEAIFSLPSNRPRNARPRFTSFSSAETLRAAKRLS